MTSLPPRRLPAAGLVLAAALSFAPAVGAQQPAPPPAGAPDLRPAEIQRLFDAYLVMEAQQTLGLKDDQYGPFLTRLRHLQDTRRRFLIERGRMLGELGRMSGPRATGDDAAITERLAALQELESRSAAETRKAYADLDALLSPRQQARFRVFEEQIERRKLELMLRARQNVRQRLPRR
ncbi:MAG: hypothetical protein AB7O28_03435 [Vicinamibacterales bacterium]